MASNLLDDLKIRAAKPKSKAHTLRDGNGLFLLIHPNGSKYFQLRTTLHGKSKLVRLGVYPNLSLSDARIKSLEAIKLVQSEIDPVIEKKLVRAKARQSAENTFKEVAKVWLSVKKATLADSTHLKIEQTFNANVYRKLGNYPLEKIDNVMVRNCLLVMQERGATELMEKTRGWIKQVFDFALADRLINENPIPIKDIRLEQHEGKSFEYLKTTIDAGKFLRSLVDYGGSFEVQACATLQMHFATRPSELRLALWVEFDLPNGIWTIPWQRLKSGKKHKIPHLVPLSHQVISILKQLQIFSGDSEYLFTSMKGKPFSEATLRKIFRDCFTDYRIHPHGCRHFFSTEANGSRLFRKDVIEKALTHADKNQTRGDYNFQKYFEERQELMQWWSDQLDLMRDGAKVLPLKTAN